MARSTLEVAMKVCVLVAVLALAVAGLGGCRSGDMLTLSETNGEMQSRVARNIDETQRQIPDDILMMMLLDKPIRLSEKPIPSH
jgi:hypothetical protein